MKELVVISGKGGTGKTSIVASFAAVAENKVIADCDVDAADLHLVLHPHIEYSGSFSGGKKAFINPNLCTACNSCRELCAFDAISLNNSSNSGDPEQYLIDPISCEGCGVCAHFCPADAITLESVENGQWFISRTRFGPMVHAKLGIAEENSGKLVTIIRKQARKIAEEHKYDCLIVDGAPGIGCPVIASITGTDLVLAVTEPTLSGLHDLERVCTLTKHFKIPTVVCINKYDLNAQITAELEQRMKSSGTQVIGKVRYDSAVTKAQIMKTSVVEYTGGLVSQEIKSLWRHVLYRLV